MRQVGRTLPIIALASGVPMAACARSARQVEITQAQPAAIAELWQQPDGEPTRRPWWPRRARYTAKIKEKIAQGLTFTASR